jgi:hypothetical protein
MCPRKLREFEAEIGPRCGIDSQKNALSVSTIDDFEFCGTVVSDRVTDEASPFCLC